MVETGWRTDDLTEKGFRGRRTAGAGAGAGGHDDGGGAGDGAGRDVRVLVKKYCWQSGGGLIYHPSTHFIHEEGGLLAITSPHTFPFLLNSFALTGLID